MVGKPFWKAKRGREALPKSRRSGETITEGRKGSEGDGSPIWRAVMGQGDLSEGLVGSGGPPRGLGVVYRLSQ